MRGGGKVSKAQRVFNFIKKHEDKAFFSTKITDALKKWRTFLPILRVGHEEL